MYVYVRCVKGVGGKVHRIPLSYHIISYLHPPNSQSDTHTHIYDMTEGNGGPWPPPPFTHRTYTYIPILLIVEIQVHQTNSRAVSLKIVGSSGCLSQAVGVKQMPMPGFTHPGHRPWGYGTYLIQKMCAR